MPSKRLAPEPEQLVHITARTNNRADFPIEMSAIWSILCSGLHFIHHAEDVQIVSFVLMPNHVHLLARFPRANMSPVMNYWMGQMSRQINFFAGSQNHLWGRRFHSSIIEDINYALTVYKYVYRNPCRAGLAFVPEEYAYSTLRGKLGLSKLIIPVTEDLTLFSDVEGTLKWLKQGPSKEQSDLIKLALSRQSFSAPSERFSRRPIAISSIESTRMH